MRRKGAKRGKTRKEMFKDVGEEAEEKKIIY